MKNSIIVFLVLLVVIVVNDRVLGHAKIEGDFPKFRTKPDSYQLQPQPRFLRLLASGRSLRPVLNDFRGTLNFNQTRADSASIAVEINQLKAWHRLVETALKRSELTRLVNQFLLTELKKHLNTSGFKNLKNKLRDQLQNKERGLPLLRGDTVVFRTDSSVEN